MAILSVTETESWFLYRVSGSNFIPCFLYNLVELRCFFDKISSFVYQRLKKNMYWIYYQWKICCYGSLFISSDELGIGDSDMVFFLAEKSIFSDIYFASFG